MSAKQTALREILVVEQTNPSLRRRWFESDYFDLFTWQDLSGAFTKFQLCYDADLEERALVWDRKEGFSHDEVDHGDSPSGGQQTPILVADGKFDSGTVVPRFEREAMGIPAEVRDFVLAKIREHLIESRRRKTGRRARRSSAEN
jgi:hypothetical protein